MLAAWETNTLNPRSTEGSLCDAFHFCICLKFSIIQRLKKKDGLYIVSEILIIQLHSATALPKENTQVPKELRYPKIQLVPSSILESNFTSAIPFQGIAGKSPKQGARELLARLGSKQRILR